LGWLCFTNDGGYITTGHSGVALAPVSYGSNSGVRLFMDNSDEVLVKEATADKGNLYDVGTYGFVFLFRVLDIWASYEWYAILR
jgi:hypothetical protein